MNTEAMKQAKSTLPLGKYRHFKGGLYELIAIGYDSEDTDRLLAVYRALYGDRDVWVRPLSMWCEKVEHNGETIDRFTYIGD